MPIPFLSFFTFFLVLNLESPRNTGQCRAQQDSGMGDGVHEDHLTLTNANERLY
jgi:hypothetical protein